MSFVRMILNSGARSFESAGGATTVSFTAVSCATASPTRVTRAVV